MKNEARRVGGQSMRRRGCGPQRAVRGFSLVELALVMAAAAAVAVMFLPATNTMIDQSRRKETRAKLEALEQAFVRYVMVNRRLPCPADGSLGTDKPGSGVEARNDTTEACTAMTHGVVPWRTLGVPVDQAIDSWGNFVTYRVWGKTNTGVGQAIATSLVATDGLNMSQCKPGEGDGKKPSGPEYKCKDRSSDYAKFYLATEDPNVSRGFRACEKVPCVASQTGQAFSSGELSRRTEGNGAAFFLISHGANEFGAYDRNGNYISTSKLEISGNAREQINANNKGLAAADQNSTFYVDAEYEEDRGDYFDDIVVRPTVISIAIAAGLGPRP